MSKMLVVPVLLADTGYSGHFKVNGAIRVNNYCLNVESIAPNPKIIRYMSTQERIILREMLMFPMNCKRRLAEQLLWYEGRGDIYHEYSHLSVVIHGINKKIKHYGRIRLNYNGAVILETFNNATR